MKVLLKKFLRSTLFQQMVGPMRFTTLIGKIPAGNDDGFTKPKLTCDNVLLLAGDMPNFQEFAGVEVVVKKATSTGKKLSQF